MGNIKAIWQIEMSMFTKIKYYKKLNIGDCFEDIFKCQDNNTIKSINYDDENKFIFEL